MKKVQLTLRCEREDFNGAVSHDFELGQIAGRVNGVVAGRGRSLPVVIVAVDLSGHVHHSHERQSEIVLSGDGEGLDGDLPGIKLAHHRQGQPWDGQHRWDPQLL